MMKRVIILFGLCLSIFVSGCVERLTFTVSGHARWELSGFLATGVAIQCCDTGDPLWDHITVNTTEEGLEGSVDFESPVGGVVKTSEPTTCSGEYKLEIWDQDFSGEPIVRAIYNGSIVSEEYRYTGGNLEKQEKEIIALFSSGFTQKEGFLESVRSSIPGMGELWLNSIDGNDIRIVGELENELYPLSGGTRIKCWGIPIENTREFEIKYYTIVSDNNKPLIGYLYVENDVWELGEDQLLHLVSGNFYFTDNREKVHLLNPPESMKSRIFEPGQRAKMVIYGAQDYRNGEVVIDHILSYVVLYTESTIFVAPKNQKISFKCVDAGRSANNKLTIQNRGLYSLRYSLSIDNDVFKASIANGVLHTAENDVIDISFSPPIDSRPDTSFTGILTIHSEDRVQPTIEMTLNGTVCRPFLATSPAELNFNVVGLNFSCKKEVIITNDGTYPATIDKIDSPTDVFKVFLPAKLPLSLDPDSSIRVSIECTPKDARLQSAYLLIDGFARNTPISYRMNVIGEQTPQAQFVTSSIYQSLTFGPKKEIDWQSFSKLFTETATLNGMNFTDFKQYFNQQITDNNIKSLTFIEKDISTKITGCNLNEITSLFDVIISHGNIMKDGKLIILFGIILQDGVNYWRIHDIKLIGLF